ncbi:CynX/NimT family MFS transporter [Planomicrobium sp. YIM 101495]|uniref:MFS transporter n=1 Tax=Planomicrobium sp. YIM 101495 TaxID=2665160 RepID=UPI0012B9DAAF|nr:MFS transporter [Planomicrobium sp. YIM 101495]MTD29791.1 MFS transporter [Planomicrobium sp. YIM 101495]
MREQKKWALPFMVISIFIISLNLRPAISSIGPLLDTIRDDLILTNSQVSLLTSIPVFCMGLFASLAVPFNRSFGLKKSVYVLITLIGLFTALRWFNPNFWTLAISAFFIGTAIAIIGPLLSATIKKNFPQRATQLISVYSFGMGLGAALASGLTGVFYAVFDWPFALAAWSLLAVLALVVWKFTKFPEQDLQVKNTTGRKIASPWKDFKAWLMLIFFGLQSSLFFSFITWLAPMAIEKGFSLLEAGTILTVMTTVQLVVNLSLPGLLAKWKNRTGWILFGIVSSLTGVLLLMVPGTATIYPAAVLVGISLGMLFPLALLMPIDAAESAEEVNSWTSMIQSGGYLFSALIPLAIGMVYDVTGNHFYTNFIFIVILSFMILITLLLKNR